MRRIRKTIQAVGVGILTTALVLGMGSIAACQNTKGTFLGAGTYIAQAAVPRVMVSDYSVKHLGSADAPAGHIVSGQDFDLTITLKNTAAKSTVKNLKITVGSEAGELLPREGAGTAYVEKMDGNGEEAITFPMTAVSGLEEKSYRVNIKTEYEDGNGQEYTVDESIYIPVSLSQRIGISDILIPGSDAPTVGEIIEVTAIVNNMGAGPLYNVSVGVYGDNVETQNTYLGNIEAGKSASVDLLTKGTSVYNKAIHENHIEIRYENKDGESFTETQELTVQVVEPSFSDLEKVKGHKTHSRLVQNAIITVVVVLVIAGIVFIAYRRWKKKQKMLEDL